MTILSELNTLFNSLSIQSETGKLSDKATEEYVVLDLEATGTSEFNYIIELSAFKISDGKIIDFGLASFSASQTELIRQKTEISYNQVQFSATNYKPMVDGSFDYMETNNIRPLSGNPLGSVFREDNSQTRRLKKLLLSLMEKYNLGSDSILLSWILQHPAKVIRIAGTVNVARIQSLMKAVELELDKEDWFAIWVESMGNDVP